MRRSELLAAMADVLPEDAIRFDANVNSIISHATGGDSSRTSSHSIRTCFADCRSCEGKLE